MPASRGQAWPGGGQNFPIGIATVVALPHAAFFGDDANRRYAANGAKTRRPDLNVDPVLERYRVARNAAVPAAKLFHKRRKLRNVRENAPDKIVALPRLQRIRRHDRQHAALARAKDRTVIAATRQISRQCAYGACLATTPPRDNPKLFHGLAWRFRAARKLGEYVHFIRP